MCTLCKLGIPSVAGMESQVFEFHHIVPKSQGGTDDPKNLIEICRFHHAKFQSSAWTNMFRWAKVYDDQAEVEDYPDIEPDGCVTAMFGKCIGDFGFGTEEFDIIPDTLKSIFVGRVDIRINDWCVDVCPIATKCLTKTRIALREEIENARPV